jgi:hypothetical protein
LAADDFGGKDFRKCQTQITLKTGQYIAIEVVAVILQQTPTYIE